MPNSSILRVTLCSVVVFLLVGWLSAEDAQQKRSVDETGSVEAVSGKSKLDTVQVTATGVGNTVEESEKNALINAIQQVVGLYVDGETLVKNEQVKYHSFLRGNNLQAFEALLEGFQTVAQPNTTHPAPGNMISPLAQFIGGSHLAEGGKLLGHGYHGTLNLLTDTILMKRFVAAILLGEGFDTPFLIRFLDIVEVLPAYPHHATGLRYIVE